MNPFHLLMVAYSTLFFQSRDGKKKTTAEEIGYVQSFKNSQYQ